MFLFLSLLLFRIFLYKYHNYKYVIYIKYAINVALSFNDKFCINQINFSLAKILLSI